MAKRALLKLVQRANARLPEADYQILLTAVADEVIGYGPIGEYLRDPSVSEVMVNGAQSNLHRAQGQADRDGDAL